VVRSERAVAALIARLALHDFAERWWDYAAIEDVIRTTILRHFAKHGRAPTVDNLRDAVGVPADEVRQSLHRLRARDLVVFDTAEDRITGAYPFSDRDTGHRVRFLDGLTVNAMCAIDALGAGAMCGRDAAIESRCKSCGAAVHVVTAEHGYALHSHAPADAVVWSSLNYADGCGATSSCASTSFFCSEEHLQEWLAGRHPDVRGHCLSIEEAHEIGVAIFSPMLATASS